MLKKICLYLTKYVYDRKLSKVQRVEHDENDAMNAKYLSNLKCDLNNLTINSCTHCFSYQIIKKEPQNCLLYPSTRGTLI